MTTFHYHAKNDRGEDVAGQIEALTQQEAKEILTQRGWRVVEIFTERTDPRKSSGDVLTATEVEEIGSYVSTLGATGLPLADGLRAAAEDCESWRVADALRTLAERLSRGESLESMIRSSPKIFPAHVGGLVIAANQTGRLGTALTELLEHQHDRTALRQGVLQSLAYPLFVACLAMLLLGLGFTFISVPFERMFSDFALRLPWITEMFFWLRDYGMLAIAGTVTVISIAAVAIRFGLGRTRWYGFLTTIPLFGPLWYWVGIAEWSSLLSVLLRYEIALPEALRLAASGVRHGYLEHISALSAQATEQGQPFSEWFSRQRRLPASVLPLLRWGENFGAMSEAFAAVHELASRRAIIRSTLLRSLLPPLVFIGIAFVVLLTVVALFSPLISLIQALS